MEKIYIVITYTGTILSKIVKFYTRDKFSHVSIALDKNLDKMYSFGRLNPYNPFWGGFVHEKIDRGTFKRFKNTEAIIYSLEVTEKQYRTITKKIEFIKQNKEYFSFNVIGLFAVCLNKKIKFKHSFYCAEFVKHILEKAKIESNLPAIIKPGDFRNLPNNIEEYRGKLRDYKNEEKVLESVS